MKNILIIWFLFFSMHFFSQSGIITYNISVEEQGGEVPKGFVELLKKSLDYANKQQFALSFTKNKSKFNPIEKSNIENDYDPKAETLARLAFSTGSEFFYDDQLKTEIEKKGDGMLLKSINSIQNWDITTESKIISTYLCYKAILKIPFVNRLGENKTKEVVAWFAPSLPFSFGPKNFYGLPGLILELHENKTTYLATKIALSDKELKIDFPKGKTITKAEYENKLKAQMGM